MSDQASSGSGGYSNPGAAQPTPTWPQNAIIIPYNGFTGLNTKAAQQGIEDQQMYVCNGFMPLGPNNLRCLYGLGSAIYTVPGTSDLPTGYAFFSGNVSNGDTLTLNGATFTFVTAPGGWPDVTNNYEISIGGNAGGTVAFLLEALHTGATYLADSRLNVAAYSDAGSGTIDTFYITYNTKGLVGNLYSLAKSSSVITLSGATLTGGGVTIVNFNFNNINDTPICIVCTSDGSLSQVNLDTNITTNMGASYATGGVDFVGNPSNGDTLTLNGAVFTFVTSGGYPGGSTTNYEINIAGDGGGTMAFLVDALTSSSTYLADSRLNVATYTNNLITTMEIAYKTPGFVGNTYTLATSAGALVIALTGATLRGGKPIITSFFTQGSFTFTTNPSNDDTITLGGVVFTFVSGTPSGNQIKIEGNTPATALSAAQTLSSSLNTTIEECFYYVPTATPTTLVVLFKAIGAGPSFTLAASSGSVIVSGATLAPPLNADPDYNQWAGEYVIIVAPQPNGYWLWDGTNLFGSGGVAPQVTITNSGSVYTSPPTVSFTTNGSGTGAVFAAATVNGAVTNIAVTSPGSGFVVNDEIILTITGGGITADQATATATISATAGVASVVVTDGGNSYSSSAYVVESGGGSPNPRAQYSVQGVNGVITGITVLNQGLNYTAAPTLSITDAAGTMAALTAYLGATGQITSITIDTGGSGYTAPPAATIVGDGTGASLQATLSGTTVNGVSVLAGGENYSIALVQFEGGNDGASAQATLMPFGVSGNTVETYTSRVWVGNGKNGIESAPGNPADFSTADGAGAFQNTNSFQRYTYVQFAQSNGFLYLFSDSSLDYISGVVTSGNPATTTFNNLNVDPQHGTPWHGTVQAFGRDLIFANPVGVYVSYGGAVTKVSDALDGIYTSVPQSEWPEGFTPSAAVAIVFGIQVYILLMPIIDQETGDQVIGCLMWDGKKWWTSPQDGLNSDTVVPFCASQQFNSSLTAYISADQTTIKPMFSGLSESFLRTLYSKLWTNPGIYMTKMNREIFGLLNINFVDPGPSAASGSIFFSTNPSNGDIIVLNGVVFTFVTSGDSPSNYECNIEASTGGTIVRLYEFLNTSSTYLANAALNVATYSDTGGSSTDSLVITYNTAGTAGDNYTLGASAPSNPGVPSGPTLAGGSTGPMIYVAALSEGADGLKGNQAGPEIAVTATKTGPLVFGPLPTTNPGVLWGVRVRTTMADIQINELLLVGQNIQSNV